MELASSSPLVFALNGERIELSNVDPATTLLHYIRSETRFKGTKRGCGEGGCGACTVMVARYNPESKQVKQRSVNACLVMLCSVDGCAITTTEGLGNQRDGLHAIHKRLAAFHGSQCGFCTPGMTMAIYGQLKDHQQLQQAGHPGHEQGPTCDTMEKALQGNICRCTGYRPILDVCKSFASDVDLEDLGLNACWAEKAHAKQENLPVYDPNDDPTFPEFLKAELDGKAGHANGNGNHIAAGEMGLDSVIRFKHVAKSEELGREERLWISVTSLAEVRAAMRDLRGSNNKEVKMVVGNTSAGIYKDSRPQVYVDISQIPELVTVREDAHGLEVGAATRIAELIEYLERRARSSVVAEALADHLKKVAGRHVRNWGSVGGNLVMAQQLAFASDVATILLGAGASVKVVSLTSPYHLVAKSSLEEFLAKGTLGADKVLQSVYVPLESTHVQDVGRDISSPTTCFKTFRAAPRPYGNAVSYANAAFLAHVTPFEGRGIQIEEIRLAFGAYGTKHAIRAEKVEKHLTGKILSTSLISEAIELLKGEIVPMDGTTEKEYRVSLTIGFLFEFLQSLMLPGQLSNTLFASTPEFPHSSKQQITLQKDFYPLSQPKTKFLSELQASGEAVYVDDIPSPPRCLYAAFVLSSEAYAKILEVDAKDALRSVGAVAYISTTEIPVGGQNLGLSFIGGDEPIFADKIVGYVGEPVGVMVADTYDNAKLAVGKMHIEYDTKSVGAPIFTVEDAIVRNSIYNIPPSFSHPETIGDIDKGFAEAEFQLDGVLISEEQKHFYMETQTILAIPEEDGCMTIYAATQTPDMMQIHVARCLGVPHHNVRIITRRLGGGFGGKGFRTLKISCAIAVAAYKLRRPVRMSLDRNTDMHVIGGRHPSTFKYTVAFNKTGKITGLRANLLVEAGWHPDVSTLMAKTMLAGLKKYDWGSFDINVAVCKTNHLPKTAVRAPGYVQGSVFADMIQDEVASYLGMNGDMVRERNLHTLQTLSLHYLDVESARDENQYTLPTMWSRLKAQSRKEERAKEIEAFNQRSRWIKRGIAMVTSVYDITVRGNTATVSIFEDGSIVAEVGGVEMGQGLYTKVRQAIAYFLSPLWRDQHNNGGHEPDVMGMIENIRVLQSDVLSLPNAPFDGGSSTSEGSVAAAERACGVLVQRLLPHKKQLREQSDGIDVSWSQLCYTAKLMEIDLQAHERWVTKPNSIYLTYGAGVSEVELNTLTGEVRILAADLIFDSGRSFNLAIDIGQVEGAFVQGTGFILREKVIYDAKGKLVSDGTWTYKPPTIDTIPHKLNVELFDSPFIKERVLSSKAVGEPPVLLAGSVHCALRNAIRAARKNNHHDGSEDVDRFQFNVLPATMDSIKSLCGRDNVEHYLRTAVATKSN